MSGKKIDELSRAVDKRFSRASSQSFFAQMKSVDDKKRICVVTVGELEYVDVLLYSTVKADLKGIHCIPKVGSQVVVSRLQGTDNLFVSQYSEVDKIIITIGDKVTAEMDSERLSYINDKCSVTATDKEIELKQNETTVKVTDKGLTLVKGSFGLLKTLDALCDAITKLTVSTAVGASTPPINLADFTKIKTELKNYMEG